ncbi:MAG: ferrous iron transport protein A [Epsilonproteobacteria bacterium]|nr:ferrous iron transport protein A [Campylobacterota bacterium]
MTLKDLKINDEGIIKKIKCQEPLKSRLFGLGVAKGVKIKVLKHTAAKGTFEILVDSTRIAIRKEEAECIEVEKNNETD